MTSKMMVKNFDQRPRPWLQQTTPTTCNQ